MLAGDMVMRSDPPEDARAATPGPFGGSTFGRRFFAHNHAARLVGDELLAWY